MEHANISRNEKLFKRLANLPQKILSLDGTENLTDFVLHDLCSENCFNLSKAAYFIDNPDFNCFKGIGGYDCGSSDLNWEKPQLFREHLLKCDFNNKVRNINLASRQKTSSSYDNVAKEIAGMLDIHNPRFYSWPMKHDNSGLFIFEAAGSEGFSDECLSGVCVLGFCPIY